MNGGVTGRVPRSQPTATAGAAKNVSSPGPQAQKLRTGDWIPLIKSAGVEPTGNKRQNKLNVELDSKLGTARLCFFFPLEAPLRSKKCRGPNRVPTVGRERGRALD